MLKIAIFLDEIFCSDLLCTRFAAHCKACTHTYNIAHRRMEKISWVDKIGNEEVLQKST